MERKCRTIFGYYWFVIGLSFPIFHAKSSIWHHSFSGKQEQNQFALWTLTSLSAISSVSWLWMLCLWKELSAHSLGCRRIHSKPLSFLHTTENFTLNRGLAFTGFGNKAISYCVCLIPNTLKASDLSLSMYMWMVQLEEFKKTKWNPDETRFLFPKVYMPPFVSTLQLWLIKNSQKIRVKNTPGRWELFLDCTVSWDNGSAGPTTPGLSSFSVIATIPSTVRLLFGHASGIFSPPKLRWQGLLGCECKWSTFLNLAPQG